MNEFYMTDAEDVAMSDEEHEEEVARQIAEWRALTVDEVEQVLGRSITSLERQVHEHPDAVYMWQQPTSGRRSNWCRKPLQLGERYRLIWKNLDHFIEDVAPEHPRCATGLRLVVGGEGMGAPHEDDGPDPA